MTCRRYTFIGSFYFKFKSYFIAYFACFLYFFFIEEQFYTAEVFGRREIVDELLFKWIEWGQHRFVLIVKTTFVYWIPIRITQSGKWIGNQEICMKESIFLCFLFGVNIKSVYLCRPFEKTQGPVAQLNRAFDYGSKGFWFESRRGHERSFTEMWSFFYARSSIE